MGRGGAKAPSLSYLSSNQRRVVRLSGWILEGKNFAAVFLKRDGTPRSAVGGEGMPVPPEKSLPQERNRVGCMAYRSRLRSGEKRRAPNVLERRRSKAEYPGQGHAFGGALAALVTRRFVKGRNCPRFACAVTTPRTVSGAGGRLRCLRFDLSRRAAACNLSGDTFAGKRNSFCDGMTGRSDH